MQEKEEINELTKDLASDGCETRLDSLFRLKDSTKKLLSIIEDIQSKNSTNGLIHIPAPIISDLNENSLQSCDDECTVFKRLTRKCNCLNRKEYNDFVIHFNENTKYLTSDLGEIIKNTRILKKFLYMGDGYSKNALMFLNEGLMKSPHSEKVEIILACSHADICNVFDDDSYVLIFILWPSKYEDFGDQMTQSLAARVLYRIAIVEEGRRYLNFNSKITNDIKRVLRRKAGQLDNDTLEFLNSTLNLLSPTIAPHISTTYYCKADEGMTNKIVNELVHFRVYMTLSEIIGSLDLLNKLSDTNRGQEQLKQNFIFLMSLFKHLLMEYDNNEINVLITSIINNITLKKLSSSSNCGPKKFYVTHIATEPIPVKDEMHQIPSKKCLRKVIKSRLGIDFRKPKINLKSV